MADQWSAQTVCEHFFNHSSMASVAILTDDCITQAWSTRALPSSVYWASRKQAPAEVTSLRGGGQLYFPHQFTRQVYPLHKQDNLLGYSKNLGEVVVDRMLSFILFCCWMWLNAYLYKERGKKIKSPWNKNPNFFLLTYTCNFNICNTLLSLFKLNLKLTT